MYNAVDTQYVKAIQVANPAAGADWSITAPGIELWRVIGVRGLLTTSATVATRVPSLVLGTADGNVAQAAGVGTIAASLAAVWSGFSGSPNSAGGGLAHQWAMPTDGFLLLPGWTLSSSTALIDATDQWSLVRALVVAYPTGPVERLTPDVYTIREPKG